MADIPDYMRDFDMNIDYGFTAVESKPVETTQVVEQSSLEMSKLKSEVNDVKSMVSEIMQILNQKETIEKEISSVEVQNKFKEVEKLILPLLYNLSKSDEPYIHWPNRGPIIKAQIDKLLSITRS
jgi:hypothetical protein